MLEKVNILLLEITGVCIYIFLIMFIVKKRFKVSNVSRIRINWFSETVSRTNVKTMFFFFLIAVGVETSIVVFFGRQFNTDQFLVIKHCPNECHQ